MDLVTILNIFVCDWTPRKPEDYLLSNIFMFCMLKEMIEIEML